MVKLVVLERVVLVVPLIVAVINRDYVEVFPVVLEGGMRDR